VTFEEYMKQAKRTMDDNPQALLNATLGLCGEAGEFSELVKKTTFHGKPWNREQAVSELGDVLFYLAMAADAIGVSLDTVAYGNIEKLQARYPNGFVQGGGNRDGQ
jgi:NTP pyrophosphatase (non-canonical NTP hydrolase)